MIYEKSFLSFFYYFVCCNFYVVIASGVLITTKTQVLDASSFSLGIAKNNFGRASSGLRKAYPVWGGT